MKVWSNLRALLIGLVIIGAACSQSPPAEIALLEGRVDSLFADHIDIRRSGIDFSASSDDTSKPI